LVETIERSQLVVEALRRCHRRRVRRRRRRPDRRRRRRRSRPLADASAATAAADAADDVLGGRSAAGHADGAASRTTGQTVRKPGHVLVLFLAKMDSEKGWPGEAEAS